MGLLVTVVVFLLSFDMAETRAMAIMVAETVVASAAEANPFNRVTFFCSSALFFKLLDIGSRFHVRAHHMCMCACVCVRVFFMKYFYNL